MTTKRKVRYPDQEFVHEVAVNFDTSNSNKKSKVLFVKCKSKPHKKTDEVVYKATGGNKEATDLIEDALRFSFPNTCKFCRLL